LAHALDPAPACGFTTDEVGARDADEAVELALEDDEDFDIGSASSSQRLALEASLPSRS